MRLLLFGAWLAYASCCLAEVDDFNSPSLNTNKWSLTTEFSDDFVHTNGFISFKSTNETAPALGYIYWKEKMSFSNNWNAKIQAYINPSFQPSNNIPSGVPPSENTNALGGESEFWDGGPKIYGYGVRLDGTIEAQIGVINNPNNSTNTLYANSLLKGRLLDSNIYKKYFNPNFNTNSTDEGNMDSQFKEVLSDKVVLELGYDANSGSLYSKMFDYSDNTMGSLLYQDSFKIKLTQGESISDFENTALHENLTIWEPINDVYVFVGSDTYFSEAPVGSATLDNFEIVPEPSALSLLAVGLGVVLRRRRRTF